MAVSFPSLATVKAQLAGYFQTQLAGWDLSSKGAFGKVKAALTLTVYSFLATARQIDRDAVPTTATSSEGLDEWAENGVGLSNGDGGYGRKLAVAATGGVATFTGASGTIYPVSGTLTASDGITKFVQLSTVTINGSSATGSVNATTRGIAGNLEVGETLTVDSQPIGGVGTATVSTALTGGLDIATNAATLVRIQSRLRNPPKGGVAHDYKVWAEDESDVDGITAYVYPRRHGTGTVDTVIAQAGTGVARIATSGMISTVNDYIETVRPVCVESSNVMTPTMNVSGQGVIVTCRVTPAAGFGFDFVDTATAYPRVISGAMSSGLRIMGRPSSGMVVGDRIQVCNMSTGSPATPEQRTVTAIDLATISGNTILALSSGLSAYPQSGNPVFAGGPVVDAVANAVLGLIDGLGPSKAGGYADSSDEWDDTLRIDQIIRVSLNATNATSGTPSSGALLLTDFVSDPTINSGAANVTPTDNGTDPPGMLWAMMINVIQ